LTLHNSLVVCVNRKQTDLLPKKERLVPKSQTGRSYADGYVGAYHGLTRAAKLESSYQPKFAATVLDFD